MTKRGLAAVSGNHLEQHRSKRKDEGRNMYGVECMECDEAIAEKNGCIAVLNDKAGDVETHTETYLTGKNAEASAIGSFSAQTEYNSFDTSPNKEDDSSADGSSSCERNIIISVTTKGCKRSNSSQSNEAPLYQLEHACTSSCKRSNSSQSNEAPLYQLEHACTSSDNSSEATHSATVNGHLLNDILPVEKNGLLENYDTALEESIIPEVFDYHNGLKSTSLKPHNTLKSREDNIPGNSAVTEIAGGISALQNNINGETGPQSYMTEGPSIKADVAEKHKVDLTLNYDSCSAQVARQHMIGSMPLQTECGNDENPAKSFRKTIQTTVSEKMNCTMHEEKISECTSSSTISVEINQKVLYANFKGELSFPPSPITGVIDCFVGKPNGQNDNLDSPNEEEAAFSFQPPNQKFSKEIPKNEIGFDMLGVLGRVAESHVSSQNLSELPLDVVSIGILGGRVAQQKEGIASFSCSSTLEEDPLSKETKKEVKEIGSTPPERSLTRSTRKKLLVLDLNGMLCDIVNDYYTSFKVEKKIGGKPIFKRPFCDDFLKFCFDNFYIGIWSSRRKYNVDSILDYLMGEFKHKLQFCWDQSKCTMTGAKTIENQHKPLVLKELTKLWNKEESDLPWEKGELSPSNTLLLDDSPYKALCNPPNTAIFPHPYNYKDEADNSLGPGGEIRVYLERLLISDDVQRYVEEHPFGQSAITASNQHWNFYLKIIKSHATPLS